MRVDVEGIYRVMEDSRRTRKRYGNENGVRAMKCCAIHHMFATILRKIFLIVSILRKILMELPLLSR